MRKVSFDIYTIQDHPEKAKCFKWINENWHDLGQHCIDDMAASLKALALATGGTLDYCIGINPDRNERVTIKDYNPSLLAKLWHQRDECPLTGMCYDYEVIKGLYDEDLGFQVLKTLHKEGEFIYSDEGLEDLCNGNDYEFYEDGKLYSE